MTPERWARYAQLSPAEWGVLADLLELASDEFGNHGCNDYSLPDTQEMRALVHCAQKDDREILVYRGEICTQDWLLMSCFARFARAKAGQP